MRAWSVYDNLNEMNFERRGTPLDVLGIGQKILIEKHQEEEKKLQEKLEEMKIKMEEYEES